MRAAAVLGELNDLTQGGRGEVAILTAREADALVALVQDLQGVVDATFALLEEAGDQPIGVIEEEGDGEHNRAGMFTGFRPLMTAPSLRDAIDKLVAESTP